MSVTELRPLVKNRHNSMGIQFYTEGDISVNSMSAIHEFATKTVPWDK